ncbi:MAG: DUF5709 domain-containing protein [Bifidobacteriaceae bacterium]|jgi:hypothetical protein|nr:DUF5709 domain-containing protein [Bifidobacteriaceae bacterium]
MARFTDAPLDPPFDAAQNTAADLLTPGGIDPLDTGYDPPEYEPVEARRLVREGEVESLTERLDSEEPEVWELTGELVDWARAGRLEAMTEGRVADVFAQDDGLDGLAFSAEEAAMHYDD